MTRSTGSGSRNRASEPSMRGVGFVTLRAVCLGVVCAVSALLLTGGSIFTASPRTQSVSKSSVPETGPQTKSHIANDPQTWPERLYGRWAHGLTTSSSFFPIAVFAQSPSGGDVPRPYRNQAQAFRAMGVNVFVGVDGWPVGFGRDGRELAAACANHEYMLAGGDVYSDRSATSVASVQKVLAKNRRCAKYLVGYQMGIDEPACYVNVAALVHKISSEDATRMVYINQAGWYPRNNNRGCRVNLRAPSIASADDYAVTNPWSPNCRRPDKPSDCLWQYGPETRYMRQDVGPDKAVWVFVETGGTELGFSSQNGSVCHPSINLCSRGNEYRATTSQVNSAAWLTLINGSNGIEWFCDDITAADACAGGGPDGHATRGSSIIARNLSYIDHRIESFARELNVPSSRPSAVRSSNRRVPIAEMVKVVNGVTYVFAESDRNGETTATFGLGPSFAGAHAVVIYDSDARYDRANSEQGNELVLGSRGSFSDAFGANGANYQVKIYKIVPFSSGNGSEPQQKVVTATTSKGVRRRISA
jgi:hypothetical protein